MNVRPDGSMVLDAHAIIVRPVGFRRGRLVRLTYLGRMELKKERKASGSYWNVALPVNTSVPACA